MASSGVGLHAACVIRRLEWPLQRDRREKEAVIYLDLFHSPFETTAIITNTIYATEPALLRDSPGA